MNPELETEAKLYVCEQVKRKECDFSAKKLAQFKTDLFYELNPDIQKPSGTSILVRSESSVKRDLIKWGFSYGNNSKRPYFEGHERPDVVDHRLSFVDHFVSRRDQYYTVDQNDHLIWIEPKEFPTVVFFHDESTFRSGEQSAKRWHGPDPAFISKGRGKSWMVSDFIVAHPSGPFFSLSDDEFDDACKKYPSLLDPLECTYVERSCTGGMIPGQHGYFDSESVERQFERLCQMLCFKKALKLPTHRFEVVFDKLTQNWKSIFMTSGL